MDGRGRGSDAPDNSKGVGCTGEQIGKPGFITVNNCEKILPKAQLVKDCRPKYFVCKSYKATMRTT